MGEHIDGNMSRWNALPVRSLAVIPRVITE